MSKYCLTYFDIAEKALPLHIWQRRRIKGKIADRYPDKRGEVLDLFSSVIDCIIAQEPSATFTDYDLNGILVSQLLALQAEELLPKIKHMYDQNLVDRQYNGYWEDVERSMKREKHSVTRRPTDIKEIYRTLKSQFG